MDDHTPATDEPEDRRLNPPRGESVATDTRDAPAAARHLDHAQGSSGLQATESQSKSGPPIARTDWIAEDEPDPLRAGPWFARPGPRSATARLPLATRPLPRPQRFAPTTRWRRARNAVILVVLVLLAVGSCVGGNALATAVRAYLSGAPSPTTLPAPTVTATPDYLPTPSR